MTTSLSDLFFSYWSFDAIKANILVFFDLSFALALGLVVGYERTYRGRAAGMRTYGLVCMASAALTVSAGLSPYWFGGSATNMGLIDPTRVVQGIVTGIGFLGAGIIMKDGLNISGLTTAASIWASSVIGILVGFGFHLSAILLTILSASFMMWGSAIESFLPARPGVFVLMKFVAGFLPDEKIIRETIEAKGYEIASGSFSIHSHEEHTEWRFVVISQGKDKGSSLIILSQAMASIPKLSSFRLTSARN